MYRVAQKSKLLTQYNSLLFRATLYSCKILSYNVHEFSAERKTLRNSFTILNKVK